MTIRKISIARAIVPVFCAISIFFLSTKKISAPDIFSYSDKIYHAVAYFIFAMTIMWAFQPKQGNSWGRIVKASVLIAFIYGLSMEIVQHFISYRNASVADAVANGLGAVAAIPGAFFLERLKRKRRNSHDW